MKIERAMEIVDPEHREHYESIKLVNEACIMGRAALKTKLLVKPINDNFPWAECPVCGAYLDMRTMQEAVQNSEITYCWKCSQAIDWSVSDDELFM